VELRHQEVRMMPGNDAIGDRGASALNTVLAMVIGDVSHQRIGAGRVARITRPGGTIAVRLRNEPSLMG
jgi:hypothetical protein